MRSSRWTKECDAFWAEYRAEKVLLAVHGQGAPLETVVLPLATIERVLGEMSEEPTL